MKAKRAISKYFLHFFCFLILTACSPSREQIAATMAVQTIEARGTANAKNTETSQLALTDVADAEIVEATGIALTEAANATTTPTLVPSPTVDLASVVYLADLNPIFFSVYRDYFWVRQIGGNMGPEKLSTGDPLTGVDGKVYENGIYIMAGTLDELGNPHWDDPSILTYYLNGEYASFRATLTLLRVPFYGCQGIVFSVDLDNERVYESPVIRSYSRSIDIDIDATDVFRLKLQTLLQPADNGCNNALWGDPYLIPLDPNVETEPSATNTPRPITSTPDPTEANIQGRVYWESTGNPVAGVVLQLFENDMEATSDEEGQFVFEDLEGGSYSFNLRWEFDFDKADTPCDSLDPTTMIEGNWFTTFANLNAGGNMLLSIQQDEVQVNLGEITSLDIVFRCG